MDEIEIVIPKVADWAPRELDNMSVEALNKYVEDLQRELARVQSEIGNRKLCAVRRTRCSRNRWLKKKIQRFTKITLFTAALTIY